jgi:hypothetical protein
MRRNKLKIGKKQNKVKTIKTENDETTITKDNVHRIIKNYHDEYAIEPSMKTLSQITGTSISKLKSIIDQVDLYSYKMYKLEGYYGTPEIFSLFHLEVNDKHKTYFLYDNTLKKYLPMRVRSIIYDETIKNKNFDRTWNINKSDEIKWIEKIVIEVEYPETGWTVLTIPDDEIYKYFYGRVVVSFVDLPTEVFNSLEDALDAIKIWKANSVEVSDRPDVWSGFSLQQIKTTDITEEVASKLPGQIEIKNLDRDSNNTDIKVEVESSRNQVKMNEVIFAKIQQRSCGFRGKRITSEEYVSITRKINRFGIDQLKFSEKIKFVFIMIFGLHKEKKDLDKALSIAEKLLNMVRILNPFEDLNDELSDPYFFYIDKGLDKNDIYLSWLNNIGYLSILLGTIYAYKNEVTKSCYFFMQGLKTEMLLLSDEYYNFINYMLNKLYDLPKSEYSKEPVKYIHHGNGIIKKKLQKRIISDIVNDNNDIIIAHYYNQKLFGYLSETDKMFYDFSESSNRQQQLFGYLNQVKENIYETWIITSEFKLKSIKFEIKTAWEKHAFDVGTNFPKLQFQLLENFRIKRNSALLARNLYFDVDYNMINICRDEILCSATLIDLKCDNNLHPIY